jgi:predicted DNA-binding protein (UPF0251 family)
MPTRIAIQQALILECGLSYRKAAAIMKIHPRTLWQHVAAKRGSNVTPWAQRPAAQRQQAIEIARLLIEAQS